MIYNKGDIFSVKNIFFKDNGKIDTRINGHPMILPIDVSLDDSYFYFFLITSQVHKLAADPDRFFPLKAKGTTKLPKASLIDLKYVYRLDKNIQAPRGYLTEELLKQVIEKYQMYAAKHKDEESDELEYLLHNVEFVN